MTRNAGIRATLRSGLRLGARGTSMLAMGLVASSLAFGPSALAQAQPKPAKKKPVAAAQAASAPAAPPEKPLDKAQLAEAKKRYGAGQTKFKAGDFEGALVDFQAADAIKSTPQTAKFIGSCQDSLGRFPDAVASYKRFIASAPPSMAAAVEDIKTRVALIEKLPGVVHVTSDPSSASLTVDGKPLPTPTPTEVELLPGHHTIHFSVPDHDDVEKEIDVVFATRSNLDATLPSNAPPPPPPAPVVVAPPPEPTPPPPAVTVGPPPAEPKHSDAAAWITGGAAVVAVGVGTVFGVMALNDKSNFNSNPTTSTADNGENHALIADMSFGVAVTLGVTSLVLFLSKDDAPAPATTSQVVTTKAKDARATKSFSITAAPILTPHSAGAGALISF